MQTVLKKIIIILIGFIATETLAQSLKVKEVSFVSKSSKITKQGNKILEEIILELKQHLESTKSYQIVLTPYYCKRDEEKCFIYKRLISISQHLKKELSDFNISVLFAHVPPACINENCCNYVTVTLIY